MEPLRLLDTGLMPARWNVAMTAALCELHADGQASDSIRLHRYPMCVLLGHGQNARSAADLAYCQRHGIELARRVTGGGAVFMSPGMLAWDVVIGRRGWGTLAALTERVCTGIAAAVARLGTPAFYRAPNAIEVDGRKLSGSSGFLQGRSAVLQGTVIVNCDFAIMSRALRAPEANLRASVTSLERELKTEPDMARVARLVAEGIAGALGRSLDAQQVGPQEMAHCEAVLREEIGSDRFVYGEIEQQAG